MEPTQSVEVVRAFYYRGKVQVIGAEIELPTLLAVELRGAHKVQFVERRVPPAAQESLPPVVKQEVPRTRGR